MTVGAPCLDFETWETMKLNHSFPFLRCFRSGVSDV
jgi:hypothetical protein